MEKTIKDKSRAARVLTARFFGLGKNFLKGTKGYRFLALRDFDIPELYEHEKIFVTGVYGSGKTYFAKRVCSIKTKPFFSFDHLHFYYRKENQSKKILKNLPSSFVIDAFKTFRYISTTFFFKIQ